MKITGYQLMDRIEALREQAQTINGQFTSALFRFKEDTDVKPEPRDLMTRYLDTERRVAALQAAQAAYNVRVTVDVMGDILSLQQAVKLIGSATRIKNNWISASKPSQESNPYSNYLELVRDKDNLYAQRVVGIEECLQLATAASDRVAALKQAIRSGNATEIDLDVAEELFT